MTIDEAIKWLPTSSGHMNRGADDPVSKHCIAYNMAIRSLEAWDKVKEELEDWIGTYSDEPCNAKYDSGVRKGLRIAIKEIDKSLSEVEGEE